MPAVLVDFSALQLALVAGAALVTAVIGGVAGYGTGILMPLVLVVLGALLVLEDGPLDRRGAAGHPSRDLP